MEKQKLSAITFEQARSLPSNGTISVENLLQKHSGEIFATALLMVSIPGLLPSTGIPLGSLFSPGMLIVGIAWLMGHKNLKLPGKLSNYQLNTETARKILLLSAKSYAYAERLCHTRHQHLTQGICLRLVGAAVVINAIIVFLPIPFGNTLPALANIVLALGIMFKDGLTVLAGLALTALSLVIGTALGLAAFWAVQKLI